MSPTLDELSHLTMPELVSLLTEAGGEPVTPEMLESDLAAGAPVNLDGTVNLVHYAARLLARRNRTRT